MFPQQQQQQQVRGQLGSKSALARTFITLERVYHAIIIIIYARVIMIFHP